MKTINATILLGVAVTLAATGVASSASAASARSLFEKYNLIGTFAWDCGKPASDSNWYYVHRVVGSDYIQRDQMRHSTTRDFVIVYESGSEPRVNEIEVSGKRDGTPTTVLYRMDGGCMRAMESMFGGRKVVTGGKAANGQVIPWLSKCSQ